MTLPRDPYDKGKVLDALVNHAWRDEEDHKPAFERMGIKTKDQLRDVIEKSMEDSDTRVFKAQPLEQKAQTVPREIYELPLCNVEGRKPVAIINPNRDKSGRVFGGTCYVPGEDGKPFDFMFAEEKRLHQFLKTGHDLRILQGGRPALRQEEQHQQVSTDVKNTSLSIGQHAEASQSFHDRLEAQKPNAAEIPNRVELSDGFLQGLSDLTAQRGAEAERGPEMDRGLDR